MWEDESDTEKRGHFLNVYNLLALHSNSNTDPLFQPISICLQLIMLIKSFINNKAYFGNLPLI